MTTNEYLNEMYTPNIFRLKNVANMISITNIVTMIDWERLLVNQLSNVKTKNIKDSFTETTVNYINNIMMTDRLVVTAITKFKIFLKFGIIQCYNKNCNLLIKIPNRYVEKKTLENERHIHVLHLLLLFFIFLMLNCYS